VVRDPTAVVVAGDSLPAVDLCAPAEIGSQAIAAETAVSYGMRSPLVP